MNENMANDEMSTNAFYNIHFCHHTGGMQISHGHELALG